jgi:DNA-binding NarL/FixJ family response regulator
MKSNDLKILLVDYSIFTACRLQELLGATGTHNTFKIATDIDDAILAMNSFNPDFVILEIGMPEKSGIELLKYIKENNLPVKVIVLTHFTISIYRKECEKYGVDYFLDKADEMDNVVSIIKNLSSKKAA